MRGTFAAELGRSVVAVGHFRQAAKLVMVPAEREFIVKRIRECESKES